MRSIDLALIIGLGVLACPGLADVVINEMEMNPRDNATMWAELYNTDDMAADVSGWTVTITDSSWLGPMTVPTDTTISGHGYLVMYGERTWPHLESGFVVLYDSDGNKVDETPSRSDLLGNDLTWGRYPDGRDTDTSGDWGYMMATMGVPNTLGRQG